MVSVLQNALILVAIIFINNADGLAVMSIDFGSEYMKIAIVKAGVPMEIVLNKESNRKTHVIVAMKDGERFFSDPAASTGVRFPPKAYWFLHDVIGKKVSNPIVKRFKKRFPYYKIREDEQMGTAIFDHDDKTSYTVEELVAMILEQAKSSAEGFAEQPIKDCVITVPAFFNQAERRAMIRAAKLANLKVLQLMNDNTAVALNYGIFRRADFNSTPVHYMFFDMGSSATTATIVSYEVVNHKNPITGFLETYPQVSISGFGYDRMLGGVEMSLRLRDHLALAFNSMKKSKNDVRRNVRSMAKLFKESNRVKHVLSANADHHAQIEGLFEDKDFKFKVSRDDVENMCEDLFPIVNDVIAQALNGSVAMEDIKEIILMGGATRMPKIQEIIKKATGRQDLGKGINTDEAAAMGAVYQAAHLSKGFRVKKFAVKDGNHFPIQVAFDRIRTDIDSGIVDTKNVKRLIFTSLNPYPQKKVMTFNKNHDDFSFSVGYSKLSDSELNNFDATTIFETSLTGVSDAYKANHVENSIESKGVKAHFRLDDSGLVNVDSVEMIFERLVDEPEEESTLTMLGNKFSSLFGSSETKDESNSTTEDNKTDKEVNSTTNLDNSTDKDGNSTKEAKPPIVKLKPKIIKVNITSSTTILDLLEPTEAKITASFNILDGLRKIDQLKAKKEKIMNELESFTVEFAEKLEKDIYTKHSTSKERETIKKALSEASEWIYEQDMDTPVETYEKKFVDLQTVANAVEDRVIAYEQLPLAYAGLDDILNYSRSFYANMSNHTVGDNDLPGSKPFTLIERKKLRNLNKDTTKWFKEQKKLQDALNPTEKPIITIGMISLKIQELDREVKYLLGKAKYFKPLPKPYIKTANATATNSTLNQNETKTNNASAEDPPKGGSTEIPLTDKKDKSHSPEDEL